MTNGPTTNPTNITFDNLLHFMNTLAGDAANNLETAIRLSTALVGAPSDPQRPADGHTPQPASFVGRAFETLVELETALARTRTVLCSLEDRVTPLKETPVGQYAAVPARLH